METTLVALRDFVGLGLAWLSLTYACYILVMVLNNWIQDHQSAVPERVRRAISYLVGFPALVIGGLLDVGFNWTYGLLLGVTHHAALSGKLKWIRESGVTGYRRRVADFVCEVMLNPFDRTPGGHC